MGPEADTTQREITVKRILEPAVLAQMALQLAACGSWTSIHPDGHRQGLEGSRHAGWLRTP
jgi:hypothetical protein